MWGASTDPSEAVRGGWFVSDTGRCLCFPVAGIWCREVLFISHELSCAYGGLWGQRQRRKVKCMQVWGKCMKVYVPGTRQLDGYLCNV